MKRAMYLFTLKASLGSITVAGMNISYSKLQCHDCDIDLLPLNFVCAGMSLLR